jgi:hypothetical protein
MNGTIYSSHSSSTFSPGDSNARAEFKVDRVQFLNLLKFPFGNRKDYRFSGNYHLKIGWTSYQASYTTEVGFGSQTTFRAASS